MEAERVVSTFARQHGINALPLTWFLNTLDVEYPDGAADVLRQVHSALDQESDASRTLPGYDPSAFIPAKRCRDGSLGITTHKRLMALLDKLPDDVHGIRREHRGQHLYVHAGDWHRWVAERQKEAAESLDCPKVSDEKEAAIEKEVAKMRAEKDARLARRN
jgi:hypothetical protein